MSDRIEKSIELKAPITRVWRALTDHHEFGEWFRVKLEGPFVVGEISHGRITYPGYEHLVWRAEVQAMESNRLFSFTWHPGAGYPEFNYAEEPSTLVEFTLTPNDGGTLLVIVESGFSKLPESQRADSLRMNDQGWTEQMGNIQSHVES